MVKIPRMTVTADFTKQFKDSIQRFRKEEVLIGIPEEASKRKDEKDSSINNATLLAMNNFGSPANNIPARPVMEIGMRNAQDEIGEQFKLAAKNVLSQGFVALDVYYNRAGIIASNSIKKAINDQDGIAPPSDATLARREAQGFKGTKALIVTGQMRNSITYVVRGKT